MIQEDYVTFEQAKALKELGFPQIIDESRDLYYDDKGNEWQNVYDIENYYLIQTQSLVQKWLREEKDIYFLAIPCIRDVMGDLSKCDYYDWRIVYNGSEPYTGLSDTYEQALSAGIDKCIDLLNVTNI